MIIQVSKNRTVGEIQYEFSEAYPFLRLEFFRIMEGRPGAAARQKQVKTAKLSEVGRLREGHLEISDITTVGSLEKTFHERFGITVQVTRKSGPVWLETTVTDSWTLWQQNEHGRELSTPMKRTLPEYDADNDQ